MASHLNREVGQAEAKWDSDMAGCNFLERTRQT